MTHYRLVLDARGPYLVDEAGVQTPVVDALRAGKVAIEHEENMRFLDGHYGPLYYMRLSRRLIGGHFIEPLTERDARNLAKAAGVEIQRLCTPIPPEPCKRVRTLHVPFGQFATLPILEDLHEGQVYDGFWARRGQATNSIAIREAGQWVEHPVEFTK
jgi:hypothetical protein